MDKTTDVTTGDKDFQSDEAGVDKKAAPKMIPEHEFKKTLDQLHEHKKLLRQYEQDKKANEEKQLEEKQEWQKLAEARAKELNDIKLKHDEQKKTIVRNTKYEALKTQAQKAGIRNEALDDLDLLDYDEKLQIEFTNTGRHSVIGVESYIEEIKSKKPHWFGGANKSYNTSTPDVVDSGSSADVTIRDVIELEKKAKKTKDPKDMAAYEGAYKKYLQRR